MMKMYGDIGSPWLISLEVLKVGEGLPFTMTEVAGEATQLRMRSVEFLSNPFLARQNLTKFHSSLS